MGPPQDLSKGPKGPSTGPLDPLRAVFSKYADDGFTLKEYTDLTIRLNGGKELYVHKVVVCKQSDFFAKALDPELNFKEAQTGTIVLNEDKPEIVEAMIQFMYTRNYRVPDFPEDFSLEGKRPAELTMLFYVDCYAIGDKYNIPGLKALSKKNFGNGDCLQKENENRPWAAVDVLSTIYTSTPPTDRGLRDVALKGCVDFAAILLNNFSFFNGMRKIDDFFFELSQVLAGIASPSVPRRHLCGNCGEERDSHEEDLPYEVKCDSCEKIFGPSEVRHSNSSDEDSESSEEESDSSEEDSSD